MTFPRNDVRAAVIALAAALYGCGSSSGGTGPTPSLTLSPSATSVLNDGTKVRITASAVDASGAAGSGTVSFLAAYGALSDPTTGTAVAASALAGGTAQVDYACNVATDSRCVAGAVFVSGMCPANRLAERPRFSAVRSSRLFGGSLRCVMPFAPSW